MEEAPGETVFFIIKGTVKITKAFNDGTEIIVDIIRDGEIFGEMSLIDLVTRSANAITQEDSMLCWTGHNSFQNCMDKMPIIAQNLLATLTNRLRHTNEKLSMFAKLDVNGKVAWTLLDLLERYGKELKTGEYLIPFRLTQGDLAGLTLASRERINHTIVNFKRLNFISIDENYYIKVINREALTSLSNI